MYTNTYFTLGIIQGTLSFITWNLSDLKAHSLGDVKATSYTSLARSLSRLSRLHQFGKALSIAQQFITTSKEQL